MVEKLGVDPTKLELATVGLGREEGDFATGLFLADCREARRGLGEDEDSGGSLGQGDRRAGEGWSHHQW